MSLIGKNVGNYRIVDKIGEGGMGSVYLGEHPMIGKKVAIKTLHPELATKEDIVSRFFTEAKAVNDIGHPNIVDIVDFGRIKDDELGADVVYFVMEFLEGDGLNTRLKRDGVGPREVIHIIRQCTSALAASHRKNIIHRDLKPENIYLIQRGDDRDYVKLLDFGIAKLTGDEGASSQHKTQAGLVIGTPAYMSPEQCEGRGEIDWRSDIYSLGVVLYELLTGRVPFVGDGFGEILVAHLTRTPDLPSAINPEVPASLEAIVMHALEKDKNRRFQSMDEFGAALDNPGAHLEVYGSPSGRTDSSTAGTLLMDHIPEGLVQPPPGMGPRVPTGQGQRPTTLSGASGEVELAKKGGRTGLVVGFAAVALLGAAAGVYWKVQQKAEADQAQIAATLQQVQQKAAAAEAAAEAARQAELNRPVKLLIDSIPRGAAIVRASVGQVGVTPYQLTFHKSEPDFDVLIKLAGYEDQKATISTKNPYSGPLSFTLVPVAPPAGSTPVAAKVEVKRPTKSRTTKSTAVAKPEAPPPTADKPKPTKQGGGDFKRDDVLAPSF